MYWIQLWDRMSYWQNLVRIQSWSWQRPWYSSETREMSSSLLHPRILPLFSEYSYYNWDLTQAIKIILEATCREIDRQHYRCSVLLQWNSNPWRLQMLITFWQKLLSMLRCISEDKILIRWIEIELFDSVGWFPPDSQMERLLKRHSFGISRCMLLI